MRRKRRRFTATFKKRVALEALRGDRTIQAIAAQHEVHPNQVKHLEAASDRRFGGGVLRRRIEAPIRAASDDPGPAREDRRADGGTGFFLRGFKR